MVKNPKLLASVLIGTALTAAGIHHAGAQTDFGPPVNVSQSSGHSYLPAMAVATETGAVHVFWQDFTSSPNLLWCSEGQGDAWPAGAPCVPNVTQSWEPRAVTDSLGRIHLVWRDRTGGEDQILYALFDGSVWSTPVDISNTDGLSKNPTVAVDPQDRPHVLWEDDSGGAAGFWEAHFDGATWSPAADTGLPYEWGSLANTIRVACDSTGTLHAVWHDGLPSDSLSTRVYHAERPPGGPWGPREAVSRGTGGEAQQQPALAVGPDDTLHCAWVELTPDLAFEVFYATKPPAGSWSVGLNVSSQHNATYRPAIAVSGGDGTARIAWRLGSPGDIYYAPAPGETPVSVSSSPGASERPALVLDGGGEAYLAWQENVAGNYEILVATTAQTPAVIRLLAVPDRSLGDVELLWTGGLPPFGVGTSLSKDVMGDWTDLTPPGGTVESSFIHEGVLRDADSRYYAVEELP